ncbi:MAG: glutamine synthetase [Parasphingorhabdus sp.]
MTSNVEMLPEGTHTVVLGVGDANGIMRGKRIPASHWPTICKNGNALSLATLAIDMTCDVWDTPYVNFDNGYPDMHMFPIAPPIASPWESGVAICMGYAEGMDHKPVPIDPRGALIAQLERAAQMGYDINVGTELEFYLLDPETKRPRDQGIQVYSLSRAAELEHVLGPIRQHLNALGIPIEQSNPEYAAGQVEVNIHYDEPLVAADRVVLFRAMIKELAMHHGYLATFMSKPFLEESGSGFHTHHSLWKNGVNQFSDNGKFNELGKSYLAGLQKRMPETALVSATTPNAYRRRKPYTFCPINSAWGLDNRTVGLRVIEGSDHAVRVEKRDGSADCNPYYLLASEIAAGLDGIEQGMQPTEMCAGNAYEFEDAVPLPNNINDALVLAKNSDWLRDVIGEDRLTILIQQAEREVEFLAAPINPVELERYLGNF